MSFANGCRAVVCVVLAAACGCRHQDTAIQRSEAYARQGNAYQAYMEIAEARRRNSDDRDLERLFWQRRLEYLLARGRELVFLEQEVEAIAAFEKALALDPQNRVARRWIERAKGKLARRAVKEGESQRSQGNLEQALLHFRQALSYVPEHQDAVAGIEKVNQYYSDRYDEASEHYSKGARARAEDLVKQSRYHHGVASDKDPSMQKAERREKEAARQLAAARYERAKVMEEKGYFGAALMEYEAVKKVLPRAGGLQERIAAMKREVEAEEMRRKGERAMRQGKHDDAEKMFNEAYELTTAKRAEISGLLLDNRKRKYDKLYQKAQDLELEYKFEAALESYKNIKDAWSSGFEDVATRIETLKNAIAQAKASMAEGQKHEKAGDLEKAVALYEEALANYPGYEGLDERVKTLRARIRN